MKLIYNFLADLAENNNKEWFSANRNRYDEAKKMMIAFTEVLINEIRTFDKDLPLIDPKSCIFRIFRDVRFSNDKSPYKTNFGSYIAPGGKKSEYAGYYFHIEPNNCFVGGGCYMPQSENLKSIRDAIVETPEEYLEIIHSKEFKSTFGEVWGDKVKTYPRGYDKNWKYIDLIRNKSYTAIAQLDSKNLDNPDLLTNTVSILRTLYPLNRFLNDAIGH
jgi:uncharacterized protein (TIGR02453 family)